MQRKLLRAMSARHGAGGARIVGISWRAGTPCTRGPLRSRALDELLGRDGVTFVILQRGLNKEERAKIAARKNVVFPESVADMDERAALVLVLNLVTSVPSTIVHFAKALGRPAWVLLTRSPEWRYLWQGDRMPWYPAATFLRQPHGRGWREVAREAVTRLAEWKN